MSVYLYLSGAAAVATAVGHSYLGETRVIGPLLSASPTEGVLKSKTYRRVLRIVWHLLSLFWVLMALMTFMFARAPEQAIVPLWFVLSGYMVSGIGNMIAIRGPHIGWILLFTASGLLGIGLLS